MFTDRNLLLAVIGLVVLTLFLASLYRKYQEMQAIRRQRIAMLLAGVEQLDRVLDQTAPLGLSRELRVALRKDLVKRLKAVQAVCASYPGVQGRIRKVQGQVDAEGPMTVNRQKSTDKSLLTGQLNALLELRRILAEGGLSEPVSAAELPGFLHDVDEARVRVQFDYHLAMYEAYRNMKASAKARSHLVALTKMIDAVKLPGEAINVMRQEAKRLSQQELEDTLKAHQLEEGAAKHTAEG